MLAAKSCSFVYQLPVGQGSMLQCMTTNSGKLVHVVVANPNINNSNEQIQTSLMVQQEPNQFKKCSFHLRCKLLWLLQVSRHMSFSWEAAALQRVCLVCCTSAVLFCCNNLTINKEVSIIITGIVENSS